MQPNAYFNMRTTGNDPFTVVGVIGIGTEPVSISIGGRVRLAQLCYRINANPSCPNATLQACTDVRSSVDNGLPPTNPDATFTLTCNTPAGVGSALPIVLTTVGGSSPVDSAFLFSYAPPELTGVPSLLAVGNATSPSNLRRQLQVRKLWVGCSQYLRKLNL